MSGIPCNPNNTVTVTAANAEFEFDDEFNIAAGAEGAYDDQFDGVAEQQQQQQVLLQQAHAPVVSNMAAAAAAATPNRGSMLNAAAPVAAAADYSDMGIGAVMSQMLELQRHSNALLAGLLNNAVAHDTHTRALKAMASGSKTVTQKVNAFLLMSLNQAAKNPSAVALTFQEGTFDHKTGTVLDISVSPGGKNTLPASFMMLSPGLKNLVGNIETSPSGVKGLYMIKAKSPDLPSRSILSANESMFVRNFAETFPKFSAETLDKGLVNNVYDDPTTGAEVCAVLAPPNHPVTEYLLAKYKRDNIDATSQWSSVAQKYSFDPKEVTIALNELKQTLVKESTSVQLDKISFPLVRAIVSPTLAKDTSKVAEKEKWTCKYEIGAHARTGSPENELDKVGCIMIGFDITYAPDTVAPASAAAVSSRAK